MKTAVYIEDGVLQMVLTPEHEFEKDLVKRFSGVPLRIESHSGAFYDCRGGWIRQSVVADREVYGGYGTRTEDKSFIIRANVVPPEPAIQPSPLAKPEAEAAVRVLLDAARSASASDDLSARMTKRLEKAVAGVDALVNPPALPDF